MNMQGPQGFRMKFHRVRFTSAAKVATVPLLIPAISAADANVIFERRSHHRGNAQRDSFGCLKIDRVPFVPLISQSKQLVCTRTRTDFESRGVSCTAILSATNLSACELERAPVKILNTGLNDGLRGEIGIFG